MYAFKLSSEGYRFDMSSEIGRKSKLVKDRYGSTLNDFSLLYCGLHGFSCTLCYLLFRLSF